LVRQWLAALAASCQWHPGLYPGRLPAKFVERDCLPPFGTKDSTMADTKTILLVDDDYELSDGLRSVLERQGYRVIQARDGQQGKQIIYQQRPDLVILDMMMPKMGGYPVLEHF